MSRRVDKIELPRIPTANSQARNPASNSNPSSTTRRRRLGRIDKQEALPLPVLHPKTYTKENTFAQRNQQLEEPFQNPWEARLGGVLNNFENRKISQRPAQRKEEDIQVEDELNNNYDGQEERMHTFQDSEELFRHMDYQDPQGTKEVGTKLQRWDQIIQEREEKFNELIKEQGTYSNNASAKQSASQISKAGGKDSSSNTIASQKMDSIRILALKNVIKEESNDLDWWEPKELKEQFEVDRYYDIELGKLLGDQYKRETDFRELGIYISKFKEMVKKQQQTD